MDEHGMSGCLAPQAHQSFAGVARDFYRNGETDGQQLHRSLLLKTTLKRELVHRFPSLGHTPENLVTCSRFYSEARPDGEIGRNLPVALAYHGNSLGQSLPRIQRCSAPNGLGSRSRANLGASR